MTEHDRSKIEDMCDVILDSGDPQFVEQLREALGLAPGESCEIITPQFDRTDGLSVPLPMVDFSKMPLLSADTLKQIGCARWDEPDGDGQVLWLYPAEWYDHIPDGLEIIDINGSREKFKRGETDDDMRFGMLPYGFMRRESAV